MQTITLPQNDSNIALLGSVITISTLTMAEGNPTYFVKKLLFLNPLFWIIIIKKN